MRRLLACLGVLVLVAASRLPAQGNPAGRVGPARGVEPEAWTKMRTRRAQRWAVVIGVSKYADPKIASLRYADRDARSFYDFLLSERAGLGGFKRENVLLLLNERATSRAIRSALRDFLKGATPDDVVYLYFAGHGAPDNDRPSDMYLLAYDTSVDSIASTGVPMSDVSEATRRVYAQDLVVIVDACHSAGVGDLEGRRGTVPNEINKRFLEQLESSGRSKVIITASRTMELSQEGPRWGGGHGVFTHYLLEGLNGGADEEGDGDQIVTLDELYTYVERHVRRDTRNAQVPTISQTTYDPKWPVSLVIPAATVSQTGRPPGASSPASPPKQPATSSASPGSTASANSGACLIDETSPNQVARAVTDLGLARAARATSDATSALREAVRLLEESDRSTNPAGRAMTLGRVLVIWSSQPGINAVTTRGTLGFQTNPTAPYDLVTAIDSAFTVVETLNANCASLTAPWRQQQIWVDQVNRAIALANDGKIDSAEVAARRALQLYRKAPYAYMVLAKVAASRSQSRAAIGYYKQAIAVATDMALADTRRALLQMVGGYAADLYESAATADKPEFLAEASAAFDALAQDPGAKYADVARAGLARVAGLAGDVGPAKQSYADQLRNPSRFSYAALMTSAVAAARADETKDAIRLFESARALNPHHRDVLYNLSRLYLIDSSYAMGVSLARELLGVDPSNPDNYQLVAIGYSGMKKAFDAKRTAARPGPAVQAYADSSSRAIDSALKYNGLKEKLSAHVVFTEFTPTDTNAVLGGTITNLCPSARSFTARFGFVDKAGNVIATQSASVGLIQPNASGSFSVTVLAAGIISFRYSPLGSCN